LITKDFPLDITHDLKVFVTFIKRAMFSLSILVLWNYWDGMGTWIGVIKTNWWLIWWWSIYVCLCCDWICECTENTHIQIFKCVQRTLASKTCWYIVHINNLVRDLNGFWFSLVFCSEKHLRTGELWWSNKSSHSRQSRPWGDWIKQKSNQKH